MVGNNRKILAAVIAAIAMLVSTDSGTALAQSTWKGPKATVANPKSGKWSADANWDTGKVPVAGSTTQLVFKSGANPGQKIRGTPPPTISPERSISIGSYWRIIPVTLTRLREIRSVL